MELKSLHTSRIPSQPPPYSQEESLNSPAVIVIPPTVNLHGGSMNSNNSVPQHTAATSTIIIPKTIGPIATPFVCPSCNNMIVTKIETSITMKQHLIAILLCSVGFWPCVPIPYLMTSCKKVRHFCPICSSYIGTYV